MNHLSTNISTILLLSFLTGFSGCGGSSSSDASPSPGQADEQAEELIGQFIDDPVRGLGYRCSSGSIGVTDSDGKYSCDVGDDVTFTVGAVTIGTVPVQVDFITPYTFFPDDHDAAINLARLLQSVDEDGDADNGFIDIDATAIASLSSNIDFGSSDFDADIQASSDIVLIDALQAQRHLDDQIIKAREERTPDDPNSISADAGRIQNVKTLSQVILDGSSSHTNGSTDELTYAWAFVSRPLQSSATLSASSVVNPQFTADLDGHYEIRLNVDADGEGASDTVIITAATGNSAPVANAGANQNVNIEESVTLDGSRSTDADEEELTYLWNFSSKAPGSSAQLSSTTSASPTFTADVEGAYRLLLIVNDGTVNSVADKVSIIASTSSAPVANAGVNQSVSIGENVILDGSRSSDANGDDLTYQWNFTSRASGSSAQLSSTTSVEPMFTADSEGTYVLHLIVNDGSADSAADKVTVTVSTDG